MASTTATDLTRALQRYGDDLYRLACLLTPNAAQAERALLGAARRLAAGPPHYDEPALIGALLAALPREPARLGRRQPEWAQPPAGREPQPLLAAIVRLPRAARTSLALSLLRSFEPAQVAAASGTDPAAVPGQLRDTLLTLAPDTPTERSTSILHDPNPPEACQACRAALALADPRVQSDPAIRSHLASCSACRSADLAWQQLTTGVEQALRDALRDTRPPTRTTHELQAIANAPPGTRPRWRDDPRARIALVALPVLLIIAALVWPRGGARTPASSASGQGVPPAELVRRAIGQLYSPSQGAGVWHGQYEIAWVFPNNTTALLNADIWREPVSGQHRLQLVHHSGGGPYEFELADDNGALWYAVSANYLRALTPIELGRVSLRNAYRVTPEQREQMLASRLESGAWALAARYLRQASAAELRSWGRQRDPAGQQQQLISFVGSSPLALPADSPSGGQVTVLLTIDEASGRLREVRELTGAAGAEQSARTTWRALADELLPIATPTINNVIDQPLFDLRRAWNGSGTFSTRGTLRSPWLPLVEDAQIGSLAQLVRDRPQSVWLPTPPADAKAAIVVNLPANSPGSPLSLVYSGGGRELVLAPLAAITTFEPGGGVSVTFPPPGDPPRLEPVGDNLANLRPLPGQSYIGEFVRVDRTARTAFAARVRTRGYSRSELLAVLATLAPATLTTFSQQAPLFVETRPHDEAWRALVGALAEPPQPPAGGARRFVEQVFMRQAAGPDPLADPYHRPPYGGWPARFEHENWTRTSPQSGLPETAAVTRGPDSALLARQYRGGGQGWDYDALVSRVTLLSDQPLSNINEDQMVVLRMLECGGAQLTRRPDGAPALVLAESDWRNQSCQNPFYPQLWQLQRDGNRPNAVSEIAPLLVDLPETTLSTLIVLAADGRPGRIEVWAGAPDSGTLVSSWQRVAEELLPAEQVPADTFSATPPAAALRWLSPTPGIDPQPPAEVIGLAEALGRAPTPLFGFAPDDRGARLLSVEASPAVQPLVLQGSSTGDGGIFDGMLTDGIAIRSTSAITTTAGEAQLTLTLFQAPAELARAYLRDLAHWSFSQRTRVQVDDRSLEGWLMRDRPDGSTWLLFEIDGTLIATREPSDRALAALARLTRLE